MSRNPKPNFLSLPQIYTSVIVCEYCSNFLFLFVVKPFSKQNTHSVILDKNMYFNTYPNIVWSEDQLDSFHFKGTKISFNDNVYRINPFNRKSSRLNLPPTTNGGFQVSKLLWLTGYCFMPYQQYFSHITAGNGVKKYTLKWTWISLKARNLVYRRANLPFDPSTDGKQLLRLCFF